jgi:hypothetical protein
LGYEFLNSILVLTNCQVVVVVFIGLAAAVELIKLLAIEGRTAEKAAKMAVVIPEHFDPGPAWPAGPARARPAPGPPTNLTGRVWVEILKPAKFFFGPSLARNAVFSCFTL